jgi:transcriptional regulator with XRE-family HTH domain
MSSGFVSFVINFFRKHADFLYMGKNGTPESRPKPGTAIVERIDRMASETGTSRTELAAKAKIAKNSFANWAKRGTVPPADAALVIADELQCSVRWLVTGIKDRREEYSIEEKNLVAKFRLLDMQGRFEIKTLLEAKTVFIGRESVIDTSLPEEKKRKSG